MACPVALVLLGMAARGAADSLRGAPGGSATARQLAQCNAGGDVDVDEVCFAYCQGEYDTGEWGGIAVQDGTSEQCWQCRCDNRIAEPMGDKFFTYVAQVSGCRSAYVDQDCVDRNNGQGCYCWRLQA